MRCRVLLWILPACLGVAAATPPTVGRAIGLGLHFSGPAGLLPVVDGRRLVVTAEATDQAGVLRAEHPTELGDATRASLRAASEWLASPAAEAIGGLGQAFAQRGVTVRFDTGGRPLEGGSAGLATLVAAASALLEVPLRQDVAMTGELTADGVVQPVEGLVYKRLAVLRDDLAEMLLPAAGAEELLARVGPEAPARCRLIAVGNAEQAIVLAFGEAGPLADRYRRQAEQYHAGLAAFRDGRFDAARGALAECLSLVPGDLSSSLWLRRARLAAGEGHRPTPLEQVEILRWRGRFDEAVDLAVGVAERGGNRQRVAEAVGRVQIDRDWQRLVELVRAAREKTATGALAEAVALLETAGGIDLPGGDGPAVIAAARGDLDRAAARAEVEARPDDVDAWRRLVAVAEDRESWTDLLDGAQALARLTPDDAAAGYRHGRALLGLGRRDDAVVRLLEHLLDQPGYVDSRGLLEDLGVDVIAPTVRANVASDRDLRGIIAAQVGADDPTARLDVALDGRPVGAGDGRVTWRWDTAAGADGPRELTAVATDPSGCVGACRVVVNIANRAGLPRTDTARPPPAPAYEVPVIRGGTWLVRPVDTAVLQPAELFALELSAAGLPADRLAVGASRLRERARWADAAYPIADDRWTGARLELSLAAQADDGRAVGPRAVSLIRRDGVTGWLSRHGDQLRLTTAPEVTVRAVWLLVDGRPGPPLRPDALRRPPGGHALQAVLLDGDGNLSATPPLAWHE